MTLNVHIEVFKHISKANMHVIKYLLMEDCGSKCVMQNIEALQKYKHEIITPPETLTYSPALQKLNPNYISELALALNTLAKYIIDNNYNFEISGVNNYNITYGNLNAFISKVKYHHEDNLQTQREIIDVGVNEVLERYNHTRKYFKP